MTRRAIAPENRASGISARNPISKEVHVGYTYVDIDTLEGEGPGGMVRKTRRATGARAFGFNYFTLPPGVVGREHDHTDSNQEEVYFVVRGDGRMRIDGDELELRPGRFVRVDPESTRVPIAGDDGLELVTFGAPLEGGYEPPDWG
jgi:mannose-6-phosphate isomerase-like protein (cupin superfamily)